MRLFTGLSIGTETLRRTEEILAVLRPTARLKWSPPGNLHITSAFIGTWPEERLAELQQALAQIDVSGPIPVTISGFGFFPNPHRPHSFFLAVRTEPALAALANRIEEVLER